MTRAEAHAYIAEHSPKIVEAVRVITQPLSALEAEGKREQAVSDSVPSGAAVSQGDGYRDGGDNARPLLPLGQPPALIPADGDAARVLSTLRAPAGDAVRIRLDFIATLHPRAVAPRRFEYRRKGCDIVEVVARCLHWWSVVGERVTVLDAAQVEGTCPYCVNDGSDCDCRMALPGFPATPGHRTLHLYAGAEFVDAGHLGGEPAQGFYWRLLPIAATEG
ncbi:MAG: hypothetical protein IT356_12535 [Gemmatimonadaceae bacterium]|nr:hypothetical protein [Gemmatimonadaceae bacterium]